MKINLEEFRNALSKINKITPYLNTPGRALIIDISYGKVRVADSVQFWQIKAESLPDMQLLPVKARQLEKLVAGAKELDFNSTDTHHLFKLDKATFKLSRPVYLSYNNIEEVFLKPTLVNDLVLTLSVAELKGALDSVREAIDPQAVKLQIESDKVCLIGTDMFDNYIEYTLPANFTGKELSVAFPAPELQTLVTLLEDEETNFKLSTGTKTRPSALLANDTKSGLTCVLSPMLV